MIAEKDQILNELDRERRGHRELRLSSIGLTLLLLVGAAAKGRLAWRSLNQGAHGCKISSADLQIMIQRGYVRQSGPYIEATDHGNELIRQLIEFTNHFQKGTSHP